jgi:hypothetical protein
LDSGPPCSIRNPQSAIRNGSRPCALAFLAALTVGLAAGCGGALQIDNDKLVARSAAQVTDVPVPVGFSIDEKQSEATQTATGSRYINHIYTGRRNKDLVANFYFDQMPANHKWRADWWGKTRGMWKLHFAKGPERCDVTITDNFWGTTAINIEIYPSSLAPPAVSPNGP